MKNKMKKLIKNIVIIVLFAVGFSGCDDYLDVNKPSDAVEIEDTPMQGLMGPVMLNTVYANYYAELTFGNYTQYFGSYGSGAAGEAYNSDTWNNIYTKILPNIKQIRNKASEINAVHYEAIAKILEAINMGFAVDNWDNVPYSQTGKPFEYPFPEFDSGKQVYSQVISLLNEAISDLEGEDPAADLPAAKIGSEDLIYNGDKGKWLRAAYTFKARYQLHMMKNGGVSASDVLATIANGFTSNADNFELYFPEGKINPYYSTNILSRNTSNFYRAPNDQLISMMNGTTYPFESGIIAIDPRLPAIFENEGAIGDPWRGFMNGGSGESSDGEPANTFYKDGGYHTSESAPLILITYAEAMFIKAEAAFLVNGGTTASVGSTSEAYGAYMMGISANMSQIDVDDDDGSDYMADAAVDVSEAELMLNHIMKEKYIANIHNTETFNDMRRYDFSNEVFKGLELRLEEDSEGDYVGEWFRRVNYPLSEENANEENVLANKQLPIVDVWWAK